MPFTKPPQPQAVDRAATVPPVPSSLSQKLPIWPPSPPWPPEHDAHDSPPPWTFPDGDWASYFPAAVEQLESLIEQSLGIRHVTTVCSGTAAVELALRACRVEAGTEVILAGYDYPGNFRSVAALGATPVAVDLAPGHLTLDPTAVHEAITPLTRAILVSHLYQCLADMPALRQIADQHGLLLLEDACQAPAATVFGRPAGSWGDVATLSFGGSKVLTAGNGGAVLTNNSQIDQRLRVFQERPGRTYPLSGLQAQALVPQWHSLDAWNQIRNETVDLLTTALSEHAPHITIPPTRPAASEPPAASQPTPQAPPADCLPALYKFAWLADSQNSRDAQIAHAQRLGLPCGHGFPFFRLRGRRGRSLGSCPRSAGAAERLVVLDHRALATTGELRNHVIQAVIESAQQSASAKNH